MSEGENPNPARIADASWRFMLALLALEPDTENSGIYANKPGYHGTRAENQTRDANDGDRNYSVTDLLDLQGPDDKAAAYDWTHRAAQRGDYRTMARYGNRLRAAFDARDPRLAGWKEAQGQTDLDATPEELDFGTWAIHTPSGSHAWHWHFSERRAYVSSWTNKAAMLSILSGQTLQEYLAGGGQLITDGGDDVSGKEVWDYQVQAVSENYTASAAEYLKYNITIHRQVARVEAELAAMRAVIAQLADHIAAGGGNVDTVGILRGVDERLAVQRTHLDADTKDTVADALQAGADAVRAEQ